MVLHGRPCGRVGRCRIYEAPKLARASGPRLFLHSRPRDPHPLAPSPLAARHSSDLSRRAQRPRSSRISCTIRPRCIPGSGPGSGSFAGPGFGHGDRETGTEQGPNPGPTNREPFPAPSPTSVNEPGPVPLSAECCRRRRACGPCGAAAGGRQCFFNSLRGSTSPQAFAGRGTPTPANGTTDSEGPGSFVAQRLHGAESRFAPRGPGAEEEPHRRREADPEARRRSQAAAQGRNQERHEEELGEDGRAPSACRRPMSRVRSRTETNMIFMSARGRAPLQGPGPSPSLRRACRARWTRAGNWPGGNPEHGGGSV
jgi:hypothetical protein